MDIPNLMRSGLGAGPVGRILSAALIASAALAPLTAPAAKAAQMAQMAPTTPLAPAARTAKPPALSAAARDVAAWAVSTGDHQGHPFVIVDKSRARVTVFDAQGRPQASSPVLLGAARGDHSVPGIGQRPIADIRPDERTTPAGRFLAEPGRNSAGEDIVWVDYDAAVSMHRVRPTDPTERRLQRLATPGISDNRISYGCINVPAAFYNRHIHPVFAQGKRVVYVLPETRLAQELFGLAHFPR